MEKKYYILIIFFLIILSTGCTNKKQLTCEKIEKTTGMTINTINTSSFLKNELSSIKITINIHLDQDYIKHKSVIKESLEQQYSIYKDTKGITYQTKDNNDIITLEMIVDNSKIDKKTRKELNISSSNYNTLKKDLEGNNYTCK